MNALAKWLPRIKLVMLVLATIFGAYKGISDLRVALDEPEPTRLRAGELPEAHQGQQWLEVEGRLALEYASERRSTHKAHRDPPRSYVEVPVVGPDWTPEQPVYLLVTLGPFVGGGFDTWKARASELDRVGGELRPVPLPDADERFSELQLREPLLVLNEGTEPDAASAWFFLALMLIAGGMSASVLFQLWRERSGES